MLIYSLLLVCTVGNVPWWGDTEAQGGSLPLDDSVACGRARTQTFGPWELASEPSVWPLYISGERLGPPPASQLLACEGQIGGSGFPARAERAASCTAPAQCCCCPHIHPGAPGRVEIVPGLASRVAELGFEPGIAYSRAHVSPSFHCHGPGGEVARDASRGVSHRPFSHPKHSWPHPHSPGAGKAGDRRWQGTSKPSRSLWPA